MPRTKSESNGEKARVDTSVAYEAALGEYSQAVESLRQGDYGRARELFESVRSQTKHEPELCDRAATYTRICERKLAPPPGEPDAGGATYHRAVFLMNAGEIDEALKLLNRALGEDPLAVDVLYVRACAWALKGAAEKAVGDLRQAIAVDPKVRFQAVNDPDFEKIREEPSFIDIIEPTAAGV
jgi:tetratricopeptide (TPR) repeat protein